MKADEASTFFTRLLYGIDPSETLNKQLSDARGRQVVALLLAAPEGQLG
jgi:hypothetical protein